MKEVKKEEQCSCSQEVNEGMDFIYVNRTSRQIVPEGYPNSDKYVLEKGEGEKEMIKVNGRMYFREDYVMWLVEYSASVYRRANMNVEEFGKEMIGMAIRCADRKKGEEK